MARARARAIVAPGLIAPALFAAVFALSPRVAPAQSVDDLSAFSALMLSPAGALPPLAREVTAAGAARTDLSLRYGGWRYDVDDGVHNNIGVAVMHRIGQSSSSIGVTAAYLSLDCDCNVWISGGVTLATNLWSRTFGGVSTHLSSRLDLGGARYSGTGHARAYSADAALDAGIGVPFVAGTRLALSVFPGEGFGRISSEDEVGSGRRPMIGAALSWTFFRGLAIDAGTQRVMLPGGPTQIGAGLSWRRP